MMQVTDAVKLLYQSEFGGGHMIANPAKSLNWIRNEWEQMKAEPCAAQTPILEEIGGGICRVSLKTLEDGLAAETLNQMFVKTADRTVGTVEGFEKKLEILRELCAEGRTPFGAEELEAYLADYKAKGYPPVSHSKIYHDHYQPMYRVVSTGYTRFYEVFREIDRRMAEAGNPAAESEIVAVRTESESVPAAERVSAGAELRVERQGGSDGGAQLLVAIDGMCGSGKSTLGRILEEIYDCNVFHMDDFFLRPEQRTPERLAEPGGNVDYERFQTEILNHIADPEGFSYQVYNCGIQALDGFVQVPRKRLNIIEGAYSHHPYFGNPYDVRFLCKISPEEQVARIMKRNGPEMLERFKAVWIPMENRYFETFQIEKDATVIA